MTASPFKRKKFNDHLPAVDGGNPNDYLSLRGVKSERSPLLLGGQIQTSTAPSGRRKSNDHLLLQVGGNPNDHLSGTC